MRSVGGMVHITHVSNDVVIYGSTDLLSLPGCRAINYVSFYRDVSHTLLLCAKRVDFSESPIGNSASESNDKINF